MRLFFSILILFLSFHSITKSDEISDFEIEGISIGDSLLNLFEKELIEDEINDPSSLFYKKEEFVQIGASYKKSYRLNIESKKFDDLSIVLKPNDKFYKVYSVGGRIFCKDIKICKSKKKEITLELKSFFSNKVKIEEINKNHNADPSGNSKSYTSYFNFPNSDAYALVAVYDWSKKFETERNYPDNLKIVIVGEEFGFFLNNVQYE